MLLKRWILKPDYLTACNEAGKFVEEEPFEWHGNGLNSGDTISLDAPRKWRQLKQRTGHGAFYGMQVIIYGECIAPTLVSTNLASLINGGTIHLLGSCVIGNTITQLIFVPSLFSFRTH